MPTLIQLPTENRPTEGIKDMPLHKPYHITKDLEAYGEDIWLAASLPKPGVTYLPGQRMNALVHAAHVAYSKHHGIVLSPDAVWVTILGGVAATVNKDPEKFRSKLVKHDGKETVTVRNDFLRKKFGTEALQDAYNISQWSETIRAFPGKMKEHFVDPGLCDASLCSFSSSSEVDVVVSSIMLMESTKAFFDFRCMTCCGISHIQLTGEKADWEQLLEKTRRFVGLVDAGAWLSLLEVVLPQFIAAFAGQVNLNFWDSFYKWNHPGSGSDQVHGWINVFFPYMGSDLAPNTFMRDLAEGVLDKMLSHLKEGRWTGRAPSVNDFPLVMSSVPLTWDYFGNEYALKLVAGVCMVEITADSLVPSNGWILVSDEWTPGTPSATGINSVAVHSYYVQFQRDASESDILHAADLCTTLLGKHTQGRRAVYDKRGPSTPKILKSLRTMLVNLPESAVQEAVALIPLECTFSKS